MPIIIEIIYSGTLALLAFIPAAISQMASFYEAERYRGHNSSEMRWFRRVILLMTGTLWAALISNLTALANLTRWNGWRHWEVNFASVTVGIVTLSLVVVVLAYTLYILLLFDRLDWQMKYLERFSGGGR